MSLPWSCSQSRLMRVALLTILGTACGGTTDPGTPPPPPPPAPVVTTVQVTPTAPSLTAGDSLQATAVVKDQNGQVVTGKTPLWQTSAPAIATVSATGLVKGVAPGSATISAAVDGKTGSTAVQVSAGARIEVDSSTTVQATIGSTGGSLTLTTGNTKFLLTVPQAALDAPVTIVMRSVRILRQLPAAGQFIAAVKLEPTGTTFLKPLILKLIQPVTPVAGTVITGYLADDQGNVAALAPADRNGDTLSLAVPHFSVGGWGQFVPAQFPPAPPPPTQTASFSTFVTNFVVDEVLSAPIANFVALFQAWKNQIILPDLAGAQLPDQFFAASGNATLWYSYIKEADARLFHGALETALINDVVAVQSAMAGVLPHGITQLNARCRNNGPGVFAVDAVRAFMLQDMAVLWKLDDVPHNLDVATVVGQSCVSLINTVANFPTQPTPGLAAQLDLRYGVHFGGQNPQPLLANVVVEVSLDLAGTTTDGTQHLQTDPQGFLSGAVIPTGVGDFVAAARACIHPSNGLFLDRICNVTSVTRPFGVTINGDVQVLSQVGLAQLSNVRKIVGNLFINSPLGAQAITSTNLIELRGLREVTGDLTIANAPSVNSLTGLAGLITVGGNLRFFQLPNITSLAPLGTLTYGGLLVQGMDGLTTLNGLKAPPTAMTGGIQMTGNKHLFDASIFRGVTAIDGPLDVENNPLLPNLLDVGALTHVGGSATIGGLGLTSVAALANLQTIDGDLRIMVNDLDLVTSFSLPSLTTVGGNLNTITSHNSASPPPAALLPITFPALTDILGGEVGGGNGSGAVRPFSMAFPVLQAIGLNAGVVNITNTVGLRALTMVALNSAGVVNLDLNPQLQTLMIGSVSIGSVFNLNSNPALVSIQINGAFQVTDVANIDNNAAMVTLTFGGPIQVGGVMNIDHNNAMTTLQFSGGTVGGTLNIDDNKVLVNLLGALASVGGALNIDHNPKLSQQAAVAWAAGVAAANKQVLNNGLP